MSKVHAMKERTYKKCGRNSLTIGKVKEKKKNQKMLNTKPKIRKENIMWCEIVTVLNPYEAVTKKEDK